MRIEVWNKSYDTVAFVEAANVQITHEINKISALTFVAAEYNKYLVFGNYAVVNGVPYMIRTVNKVHTGKAQTINVEAEHIASELLNDISVEVPFINLTCLQALTAALDGNRYGWSVGETDITSRKTFDTITYTNKLSILLEIAKQYNGELEFDWETKKVNMYKTLGINTGYVINFTRNATELNIVEDGNEFGTRLYPLGKWNLTIAPINDGKKYIDSENVDKYGIVDIVWKTDITNREALLAAAQQKLKLVENPVISFNVSFVDLSKFIEEEAPELHLGDYVRIYDTDFGVNISSRIMSIVEMVDNPLETRITVDSASRAYRDWEQELAELLTTVRESKDAWDSAMNIDTSIDMEYGDKEAIEGQIFNFDKHYYERPAFFLTLDKYPTSLDAIESNVTIYGEPVSELNQELIREYTGVKLHIVGNLPVGYHCSMLALCVSPVGGTVIN